MPLARVELIAAALQHRLAAAASPAIGPLLDEWYAWLDEPATLSPKTRRPYAPKTIQRYKVSWTRLLALLPQGKQEAERRVLNMVGQMDKEGYGNCTVTGSCEAVCPKEISLDFIARMNRDYGIALLKGAPKPISGGGAG